MRTFLINKLKEKKSYDEDWTCWRYAESINIDALSNAWLDNRTSYIYQVSVVAAVDANKCDWVDAAIGMRRRDTSEPVLIGIIQFPEGENDDIARVIKRAVACLEFAHHVFDTDY